MDATTCSSEKERTAGMAFRWVGDDHDDDSQEEAPTEPEILTAPTMEECVCFLERNTTMRYILGLLMQLEKDPANSYLFYNDVVVDESRNGNYNGGSVVSPVRNERINKGYKASVQLGLYDNDHYERFLRIEPHVSWRDLVASHDVFDDDINKTNFGLDDDASSLDSEEKEYQRAREDDEEDSVETPCQQSGIPTLQDLAVMKVSSQFQKDSIVNELQHTNVLASLLKQTQYDVKQAFRQHQKQLKKATPEFAMVCLLESLANHAKDRLDLQSGWLHYQANSCGIKIIEEANQRRSEIRRNWLRARQSILDDHLSFLEQHHPYYGGNGDDGVGNIVQKKSLCLSPDCRNLFVPSHVVSSEKKRCISTHCRSWTLPNCGCITKPCRICRGPVCREHVKRDDHDCRARAVRTCGCAYEYGHFVKSGYCHRVLDDRVRDICTYCDTYCCSDCLTVCPVGGSAACKVCLKRRPHRYAAAAAAADDDDDDWHF